MPARSVTSSTPGVGRLGIEVENFVCRGRCSNTDGTHIQGQAKKLLSALFDHIIRDGEVPCTKPSPYC